MGVASWSLRLSEWQTESEEETNMKGEGIRRHLDTADLQPENLVMLEHANLADTSPPLPASSTAPRQGLINLLPGEDQRLQRKVWRDVHRGRAGMVAGHVHEARGVPPFEGPNGRPANRLPSSVDTADIDNWVLEGWPEAHLLGSLDHPSLEAMIGSGSGPGERSRKLSRRPRGLGPVLTSFGTLSRLQDDLSTLDDVGTPFAVVVALKVLL
ncbi:hypothetical protein ACCO45_008330 [Purpureocillium lilacinum]|uniref:Uncharacterized protein n=1 Tax=Purpureocillium lilacinum TaxID=33203 RepID=A0ACC4DPI0_PURLI